MYAHSLYTLFLFFVMSCTYCIFQWAVKGCSFLCWQASLLSRQQSTVGLLVLCDPRMVLSAKHQREALTQRVGSKLWCLSVPQHTEEGLGAVAWIKLQFEPCTTQCSVTPKQQLAVRSSLPSLPPPSCFLFPKWFASRQLPRVGGREVRGSLRATHWPGVTGALHSTNCPAATATAHLPRCAAEQQGQCARISGAASEWTWPGSWLHASPLSSASRSSLCLCVPPLHVQRFGDGLSWEQLCHLLFSGGHISNPWSPLCGLWMWDHMVGLYTREIERAFTSKLVVLPQVSLFPFPAFVLFCLYCLFCFVLLLFFKMSTK